VCVCKGSLIANNYSELLRLRQKSRFVDERDIGLCSATSS